MATLLDTVSRPGENRETGWVNRLFTKEGYTPEYQELKFTLHRKLLDRINLEALSSMAGERVRAEIRAAVAKLVDEEKTPLSLVEKDRVIEEILDRSEEHTSELQSLRHLVCRLLLEKKILIILILLEIVSFMSLLGAFFFMLRI